MTEGGLSGGTEQYAEQFIRQIEILGERKKH
jgi:hypothetical protein